MQLHIERILTILTINSFPIKSNQSDRPSLHLETHPQYLRATTMQLKFLSSIFCILSLVAMSGPATADSPSDYHYDAFGNRQEIRFTGREIDGRPEVILGADAPIKAGFAAPAATSISLTNQFVVKANPDKDVRQLANQWGATVVGQHNWDTSYYILEAATPKDALRISNLAFEQGQVQHSYMQFAQPRFVRNTPNDPLFGNQWHLRNTGQGGGMVGFDINVQSNWNFSNNTGLGSGVTIGIIDQRMQSNHPDLQQNFRSDRSLWMSGNASSHGTAVAGVVAARGNNGIGVTGVAPSASLAGISLLSQTMTDSSEAQALTHHFNTLTGGQFDGIHIYNNSWGPPDNATRSAAGPLVTAAMAQAINSGRNGLGNIYVWAGGNGGNVDNVNYDGYANSRYTIAVGATTNLGVRAGYSERGAALLINAMGSGGTLNIATTNSGSSYTNGFGGTSAAAPMVAGAVALMLEANPNLGWRDVQHILVQTARQTNPGHAGWVTNGAGLRHNDFYGFGTIDTTAAVGLAANWTNVQPELVASGSAIVNQLIADGSGNLNNPVFGAPTFSTIDIAENLILEHVEVVFNTTGGWAGDLEVVLTSPMGTESVLASLHPDGTAYQNWTFMTVKNWGESSAGTWTLRVRDGWASDQTTWNSWSINAYGVAIPEPTGGIVWLAITVIVLNRRNRN